VEPRLNISSIFCIVYWQVLGSLCKRIKITGDYLKNRKAIKERKKKVTILDRMTDGYKEKTQR
jgi:hypothetical protein